MIFINVFLILRKIDKKEEVLIVQINLNMLETCAEWESAL